MMTPYDEIAYARETIAMRGIVSDADYLEACAVLARLDPPDDLPPDEADPAEYLIDSDPYDVDTDDWERQGQA